MRRRKFITTALGTAAAGSAFAILKFPRGVRAAGWGGWPGEHADAIVSPERQASSVLELHVNGGMSAFETFYTVPEWGQDNYRYLWTFSQNNPAAAAYLAAQAIVEQRYATCAPNGSPLYTPFTAQGSTGVQDTNGNEIFLGPWAYPFRNRPDVLARMRVVVMAHTQVAHEAANPISFTGTRLGQPRMAGVGTAIQRYFAENPEAGGGVRAAPYAYVLYPAGYKPFNAVAATTVGFHPGSAKPLIVSVEPGSALAALLERRALEDPDAFDRAIAYYRSGYESRLKAFGHSAPARSAERDNFEFASFARHNAPALTQLFVSDTEPPINLFSTINSSPECGQQFLPIDMPAMQARMAASLLTRRSNAARYVMWIDAGIQPAVTGGHDVHARSIELNGLNLPHTFRSLLNVIATPEQVENGDAERLGLIDLDRTMVVINTEFGRTPHVQANGEVITGPGNTGTNHWPWGYVNVYIGGPMRETSVYGHMNEANGYAVNFVSPAQSRMMILQAMGIWPFSSQSYAVDDAKTGQNEVENEIDGAFFIRDQLLGLG